MQTLPPEAACCRISITSERHAAFVLPVTVAPAYDDTTALVSDITTVVWFVRKVMPVGAVAAADVEFPPHPATHEVESVLRSVNDRYITDVLELLFDADLPIPNAPRYTVTVTALAFVHVPIFSSVPSEIRYPETIEAELAPVEVSIVVYPVGTVGAVVLPARNAQTTITSPAAGLMFAVVNAADTD